MRGYFLSRLLQSVLLLLVVSVVTFLLVRSSPGGLSILVDPELDRETAAAIAHSLGLDRPLGVQYLHWLKNLAELNLGSSYVYMKPVAQMIGDRFPNTALLAGAALAIAVAVALPVGMIAALRRGSWLDSAVTAWSVTGFSIPHFWLGILLIIVFAVDLRWLPASGMTTVGVSHGAGDVLRHLVLPAVVLATSPTAELVRYVRSSLIDALREDFVRTARSKGLSERRVLYGHALRNALLPILTMVGLLVPRLLGGSAVVETVFGWPGVGLMAIDAVNHRDYPVVMGVTMFAAVVVIATNLVVDLLYGLVDPRVRLAK